MVWRTPVYEYSTDKPFECVCIGSVDQIKKPYGLYIVKSSDFDVIYTGEKLSNIIAQEELLK
jgi:hypothetical protein